MEKRAIYGVELSPMNITAGVAVVVLISVLIWQIAKPDESIPMTNVAHDASVPAAGASFDWQRSLGAAGTEELNALNDSDGLSNIEGNVLGALVGSYIALKESGTYTPAQASRVAETVAAGLQANIAYRVYGTSDIQTEPDDSAKRALAYRGDLRVALEPLLENTMYELEVFAFYIDTGDERYLAELERMAENYLLATNNVANVVVPHNAALYHLDILNALSELGTLLERMATHANDPYAAAALLRTFNTAERHMLMSFDALAGYFRTNTRSS